MENSNSKDTPNFKLHVPADVTHLDLYTIPSYSSWFSWSNIHEIERISLREFFDGSSITRTPRIYKEYRDFIISKYREDPSRRLTFTDHRKSLVGDVSVLHKVFTFLEKWGLINFSGTSSFPSSSSVVEGQKEGEKWRVKFEEGAPHGVRVVAAPNSLKPVTAPPPAAVDFGGVGGYAGEIGSKFPPLASYSDIYEDLMQQPQQQQQGKESSVVCSSCKEQCDSGYYEHAKERSFLLCKKCFDSENFEKDKSVDDFKFIDVKNQEVVWTEAETLLLLESVLKHGDDWELVAQNVKTKSKLDCITKLLQLPFGDLMLGSALRRNKVWEMNGDISSVGPMLPSSSESQETVTKENHSHEDKNVHQQIENAEEQGPPKKRLCTVPVSDANSSLMKQVARLSTLVGPHITASAAEAAIAELCYENQCSREIFDDDNSGDEIGSLPQRDEQERYSDGEQRATVPELRDTNPQQNVVSLTLHMRAATATALGAAAAHARLLANQEEREIEQLVAIIIETQFKKLQRKAKHLEDLELIMEKQNDQIEELEESIIAERMNILQEIFSTGISRGKDHTSLKPQTANVL